ncbi:MAG: hypothetical protein EP323_00085, partial [Gammaproteobacteria bacterium]
MCYSIAVSFTSAVILTGGGIACLRKAEGFNHLTGVFPALPLLFGVQQVFEGIVWWSLGANDPELLRTSALGFLLFSHVIWPIVIPFSCYLAEPLHRHKGLFLLMTLLGAVFGLSTYVPLWLHSDWLVVFERHHSIVYQMTLLYDAVLPRSVVTLAYVAIVLLPLLMSVRHSYRVLGLLMLLAAMLTAAMFKLAFISVWCFFAALISLYIYYVVVIEREAEIGTMV